MNTTVKSLLFWAVLVVVAVLIYQVSTKFQQPDQAMSFSQFMTLVDQKSVGTVTIQGQDIIGTTKDNHQFHTYAPAQYKTVSPTN